MNSILEELYKGEYAPRDKKIIDDERYQKVASIESEYEEKLLNELKGHHKELFEKFLSARIHLEYCYSLFNFSEGFKLGTKLLIEEMD